MAEPLTVSFSYGSTGQSPTIEDIVLAAEDHIPGATWIADVSEVDEWNGDWQKSLVRTEWPELSSTKLVELLRECPPIIEASLESFGEFRNAYWLTVRVVDGNRMYLMSPDRAFVHRLCDRFVPSTGPEESGDR